MRTEVRVLSDAEVAGIHERSLEVLSTTGVRVDSPEARAILADAGAAVAPGGNVRLPPRVVEAALAAAPGTFTLGARRPDRAVTLGTGDCRLVPDGEATAVLDAGSTVRRRPTGADWAAATRLIDALDEVAVYWRAVAEPVPAGRETAAAVGHWIDAFRLCSKHIQDGAADPVQARWLLEVLDVVGGGRERVARERPFSFVVCPASPLVLEAAWTDAYLATLGWSIPVAIMPMPIMGLSAPVGLASTLVLANAEVLAMLALVEAAAPGTPVVYAAAPSVMEPRSGRWTGGAIEHGLLGAAVTSIARGYGLPVLASAGGTDAHVPGVQAAWERATNWLLPVLARPDLLVGPGLLEGSTVLSLEQLVLDVEVFRRCGRVAAGIDDGRWEQVVPALAEAGPAGGFLDRPATRAAVHGGEWWIPTLGEHGTFERWSAAGRPDVVDEARTAAAAAIAGQHAPLLTEAEERELERIRAAASRVGSPSGTG